MLDYICIVQWWLPAVQIGFRHCNVVPTHKTVLTVEAVLLRVHVCSMVYSHTLIIYNRASSVDSLGDC